MSCRTAEKAMTIETNGGREGAGGRQEQATEQSLRE